LQALFNSSKELVSWNCGRIEWFWVIKLYIESAVELAISPKPGIPEAHGIIKDSTVKRMNVERNGQFATLSKGGFVLFI
jgi:hypothetical protein